MSIKRIVIDASAALKWILHDEEAISQAKDLLEDFLAGHLDLLIPTLFDYEITNGLRIAVLMKRLKEGEAIEAIEFFQKCDMERYEFREIQKLTFQLACQYQRSGYDSAYLALAKSKQLWFYTGDKKLFNALGNGLPWIKWIGDYCLGSIPE